MKPTVVTLTGPSCAGKTTLEAMLRSRGYEAAISTTTRTPRHGELNGMSYYFVSRQDFVAMREAGAMVEWVEFNGELYGLTRQEVERIAKRGSPVVVVCEPVGQKQIKRFCKDNGWDLLSVWVGGARETILYRFMKRFALLLEGAKNRTGLIERESQRLNTMFEVEQAWVAEAFMDQSKHAVYDLQIAEFGPETEQSAISQIMSTVAKMRQTVQKSA